jgi:hypothetical protein
MFFFNTILLPASITSYPSEINILSKELAEKSVCSILERTAADGKQYKTKFYSLDAVISIGSRVNSAQATPSSEFGQAKF